jgi:hypothetical protein
LAFIDRENILALRHAIDRESELTRQERHAAGQFAAHSEPGRGTDHHESVLAPIEVFPGYDDDRMRAGIGKVGNVDLAGLDH